MASRVYVSLDVSIVLRLLPPLNGVSITTFTFALYALTYGIHILNIDNGKAFIHKFTLDVSSRYLNFDAVDL